MRLLSTNLILTCCDLFSILSHPATKALGRKQVRILSYHRVCDLPDTKDFEGHVAVPPKVFAQHMAFLREKTFNVITLDELVQCKESNSKLKPKTVVITFDDGYRDNFVNALPILKEHNLRATFFLVTDSIDSDRIFPWLRLADDSKVHAQENPRLWHPLSTQEILSMRTQVSFGSHSKSHCRLTDVGESTAMEELLRSKEFLEDITSDAVTCFSYPYSYVNNRLKGLVQAAGYKAAVTDRPGTTTLSSDFYELRRFPISRRDSFARFKRKLEGAYDWPLYLVEAARTAKRLITVRAGKQDGTANNFPKG